MHFLTRASQKNGTKIAKLKTSALKQIEQYTWPGNIRELQNVMERAVITAVNGVIDINLPNTVTPTSVMSLPIKHSDHEIHQEVLSDEDIQKIVEANMLAALEQCHWKIFGNDGAAKLLGMKPTTLTSRIKRLGLTRQTKNLSPDFISI
jgi:transcriptional regulator with GAF, ATPase, and Fis domain